MTDLEYLDRAERLLQSVESCCDELNDLPGVDIDNQRVGGMVTLTFSSNSQIVINLQKPLQEVWMAARAGGFHYKWSGEAWLDTKTRHDFFQDLSTHASAQAGRRVAFEQR